MGLVRLLCYMCFISFWTLKCTERSAACIPAIEQTDQLVTICEPKLKDWQLSGIS